MSIVNTLSLESNRQIKINFDGGDLSSDAGLLLLKEFAAKIGFTKLIKSKFKTNDTSVRFHKDNENLMQMIYQIISAYFEDDCSDELTLDPVFNAILEKNGLASQPTLSRFFNRMGEDTLMQFDDIDKSLRDIIYSIKRPEHMLLDLDSTLFDTYGKQEGEGFNFHYQAHGYHPLLCYDGLTGDLLKAELRDGTLHCSNDADKFMEPYQVIQYYCGRGKMENFIKEGKSGFDFAAVSSHSKVVNANRMRLHMLAYNLFNWFRRLVLPANMRKQQVDTIRLKLIKIAARAVRSARYITFKLCSSCPYKKEFYRTLENIQQLNVQLE